MKTKSLEMFIQLIEEFVSFFFIGKIMWLDSVTNLPLKVRVILCKYRSSTSWIPPKNTSIIFGATQPCLFLHPLF